MDEFASYLLSIMLDRKFESAIDIGCAYGATTTALNQICPTVGIDISAIYIKRAKKLFPGTKFLVRDIRTYKPKKKYDVAVTHGLLIHIPPKHIKATIKKIMGFAKYAIFTESSAEISYDPRRKAKYDAKRYWEYRAKHNEDIIQSKKVRDLQMQYYFAHDYESIFNELGLRYQVVATFDENSKSRMYFVCH